MSELRSILSDQLDRLLADQGGTEVLRAVEAGQWPTGLWEACSAQDLPLALVPEAAGGVGLSWGDAAALWQGARPHGAPVPLGEAMLGGWLLAQAGSRCRAGCWRCRSAGQAPSAGTPRGWSWPRAGRIALHGAALARAGGNVGREPRDEMRPASRSPRACCPTRRGRAPGCSASPCCGRR
jgi:acyl-CoA dehydrogenase